MSILLEALRKSEKNQQVHEAPTIHSDDQAGTASESLPSGPLALMLVVALFLSGWFVWRQYQPPAGSYQPPVTLDANRTQAVPEPVKNDKQDDQTAPPGPISNNSAGQSRTPVESYQPPESSAAETTNVVQNPTEGEAGELVEDTPVNRPARPGQMAGANLPAPTSESAVSNEPTETKPEKYHPGEPAPLSYWDLPDAVRAEVPVIKFSVLVYAANPADRFVLINGQRLSEGDSAQPGLVVEEIQREGVLFSYRLYRFLVKK